MLDALRVKQFVGILVADILPWRCFPMSPLCSVICSLLSSQLLEVSLALLLCPPGMAACPLPRLEGPLASAAGL